MHVDLPHFGLGHRYTFAIAIQSINVKSEKTDMQWFHAVPQNNQCKFM